MIWTPVYNDGPRIIHDFEGSMTSALFLLQRFWHVTTAIMASKRLVGFRGCPTFIYVFSPSWVNLFIWPHVGGVASLVQEVRLLCIVSSLNFWTRGSAIVDFDQSCWGPKPVIINRNESIPSSQIYEWCWDPTFLFIPNRHIQDLLILFFPLKMQLCCW